MIYLEPGPVYTRVTSDHPEEANAIGNSLHVPDPDTGEMIAFITEDKRVLTGLIPYLLRVHQHRDWDKDSILALREPGLGVEVKIPEDYLEGITLYEEQRRAVEKFYYRQRGVIEFATGMGKTEIAAATIKMMEEMILDGFVPPVKHVALIIVEDKAAAPDFVERLEDRGIEAGVVSGNKKQFQHGVLVSNRAAWHSGLKRKDTRYRDISKEVPLLIMDEVHHLATATTWKAIAATVEAPWRLGLSATAFVETAKAALPTELHPLDSWIVGYIGQLVSVVDTRYGQDHGRLARGTVMSWPGGGQRIPHRDWVNIERDCIVHNRVRNDRAVMIATNLVRMGKKPLIIVRQIDHGRILLRLFAERGISAAFCKGGERTVFWEGVGEGFTTRDTRKDKTFDLFADGEIQVLIGNQVFNERVNIPCVTDLIPLAGGKKKKTTKQRQGRSLRIAEGKTTARIWDPYDTSNFALMHQSRKRQETSKEQGFEIVREQWMWKMELVKEKEDG